MITRTAPVGAIVGGAVGGGVLVVGGLIVLALFKTGRIEITKHGKSRSAAAAVASASGDARSAPRASEDVDGRGQT